jgi:hypothetical protein
MAVLLSAVMGVARSFAWSYKSFLVFEFLDPLCGSGLYTAGFILGMYNQPPSSLLSTVFQDTRLVGNPVMISNIPMYRAMKPWGTMFHIFQISAVEI